MGGMQACKLKAPGHTQFFLSESYRTNPTQPQPSADVYKEPGGATTGLTAVTACMGTQMMGTRDWDPTGRVVAFGPGGGVRKVRSP